MCFRKETFFNLALRLIDFRLVNFFKCETLNQTLNSSHYRIEVKDVTSKGEVMNKIFKFLFCLWVFTFALQVNAARQNKYPIVLVHGFSGWGRDEMFELKYWGGLHVDLEKDLTDYGYTTFTAAVGPISSNWDRACELYAYIKGGTVDYGKSHSEKFGHARFGRTFPGLYKQWGDLQENGNSKKIHLIGHSQGGQTARVLSQLLAQGSVEEMNSTSAEDLSSLFQGNHHWVSGVATLSSPHNGSPAVDVVGMVPIAEDFLKFIATMNNIPEKNLIYDFKLDQWGLVRSPEEDFLSYKKRVWNSNIWNTKDLASYDLSTSGAKILNSWVQAQPNVYYFSATGEDTWKDPITGFYRPAPGMTKVLQPFAAIIGSFTRDQVDQIPINNTWWPNDGLVSVTSGIGPTLGSKDVISHFDGHAKVGQWNYLGLHESMDHIAVVGWDLYNPSRLFRSLANKLGALPEK